jgi:histidyl-tRNA synthetase
LVLMNAGGGSMKSQFKRADASGAQHALIFGADELASGELTLKPLRASKEAVQQRLSLRDTAALAQALRQSPQA